MSVHAEQCKVQALLAKQVRLLHFLKSLSPASSAKNLVLELSICLKVSAYQYQRDHLVGQSTSVCKETMSMLSQSSPIGKGLGILVRSSKSHLTPTESVEWSRITPPWKFIFELTHTGKFSPFLDYLALPCSHHPHRQTDYLGFQWRDHHDHQCWCGWVVSCRKLRNPLLVNQHLRPSNHMVGSLWRWWWSLDHSHVKLSCILSETIPDTIKLSPPGNA